MLAALLAALALTGSALAAMPELPEIPELPEPPAKEAAPSLLAEETAAARDVDREGCRRAIYEGLKNMETIIDLSAYQIPVRNGGDGYLYLTDSFAEDCLQAADSPELFYVEDVYADWELKDNRYVGALKPKYYEGAGEMKTAFDVAVREALAMCRPGMDDLDKALVLHDYIVTRCRYESNWAGSANKIYTAYGALVEGAAVDQGLAKAYKYLLDQAGMESGIITCVLARGEDGKVSSRRTWNAVKLKGKWYYVYLTYDTDSVMTPGQCSRRAFLLSAESLAGMVSGISGKTDWVEQSEALGIRCDDKTYEGSAMAFRDNRWPMYGGENGTFWYVRNAGSSWQNYQIFRGPLDGPGEPVGEIFRPYMNQGAGSADNVGTTGAFGAVWLDQELYFIGRDRTLHAVSILGYGERKAEEPEIQFTPSDTAAGKEDWKLDLVGLRYKGGKLEAVSRNRPEPVLGTYDPMPIQYPIGWGEGDQRICGLTPNGDLAGVKWDGSGSAELYAVCYNREGRMISVQRVPVELKAGVNLAPLDRAISGNWKLFLAEGDSGKPLCAPAAPKPAAAAVYDPDAGEASWME